MIKMKGRIKRYLMLSFFLIKKVYIRYKSRGGRKEISMNAIYARNEEE
jgi:hypothetical protein